MIEGKVLRQRTLYESNESHPNPDSIHQSKNVDDPEVDIIIRVLARTTAVHSELCIEFYLTVTLSKEHKMVIKEISGDLFSTSKAYSMAHCVSADLRMGKGIAVKFR